MSTANEDTVSIKRSAKACDRLRSNLTDWSKYEVVTLSPTKRALLLKQGYSPIPTNGKATFVTGWRVSDIDEAQLEAWLNQYPDHNCTGNRLGPTVGVDVDITDDALVGIVADCIEKVFGSSIIARRGSKGFLVPLRCPVPFGKKVLALTDCNGVGHKIEILAEGQQFVMFGNVPESSENQKAFDYLWLEGRSPLDVAVSELPEATEAIVSSFLALASRRLGEAGCSCGISASTLSKKTASRGPAPFEDTDATINAALAWLELQPGAVQGGLNGKKQWGGDKYTFWIACELRDRGCSFETVRRLMWETWNEKCVPMWEFDGPDSLTTKIRSAFNNGQNRAGTKVDLMGNLDAAGLIDDVELPANIKNLLSTSQKKEQSLDLKQRLRQSLLTSAQFAEQVQDYDFAVDQFVPASGYTIVLGKRGSGKTIVVMDLLKSMASDQQTWMGEELDAGWYVLGVILEDKPGVKMRDEAWHKAHPMAKIAPERFKLLNYDLQGFKPQTDEEIAALMDVMREDIEAHMANVKATGGKKLVVWITTWQRFVELAQNGMSDDSGMAVGAAYLETFGVEFCTSSEDRCFAIIEAHPPKSNEETTFGSTIIENKSGSILHIATDADRKTRVATLIRSKAAEEQQCFTFTTETIELAGRDRFGNARVGAIASHLPTRGRPKSQRAVNVAKDVARRARFLDFVVSLYEGSLDQTVFTSSEVARGWLEANKTIASDRKAPPELREAARAETGRKGKSAASVVRDLSRLFKGAGRRPLPTILACGMGIGCRK